MRQPANISYFIAIEAILESRGVTLEYEKSIVITEIKISKLILDFSALFLK